MLPIHIVIPAGDHSDAAASHAPQRFRAIVPGRSHDKQPIQAAGNRVVKIFLKAALAGADAHKIALFAGAFLKAADDFAIEGIGRIVHKNRQLLGLALR